MPKRMQDAAETAMDLGERIEVKGKGGDFGGLGFWEGEGDGRLHCGMEEGEWRPETAAVVVPLGRRRREAAEEERGRRCAAAENDIGWRGFDKAEAVGG